MKRYLLILIGVFSLNISGQTTYKIEDFSKKYRGTLTVKEGSENEISIFKTENNELIITIKSDNLTFEFDNNNTIQTNTLEISYGEQSVIIYEDFNFDGVKDLAVMDGQFSCYGGPSFQIYLEIDNNLILSPEFTQLAQEYCGMFQVDKNTKTIQTMTKSGCCWHQFSEFKVEKNKPIAVKILERAISPNGITEDYIEHKRVKNQMVEKKYSRLRNDADIIIVYSLSFKNGKKMEVYRAFAFEDYLFYVFIDKNNKIELMYKDNFVFNKTKETLTFTNKHTTYKIHSKGIIVKTPKKEVNMKAIHALENTSLSSLSDLSLKNLIIN